MYERQWHSQQRLTDIFMLRRPWELTQDGHFVAILIFDGQRLVGTLLWRDVNDLDCKALGFLSVYAHPNSAADTSVKRFGTASVRFF